MIREKSQPQSRQHHGVVYVLDPTYFRFGGDIYKQKFSVAMGSPVSHIVVDVYLENLERNSLLRSQTSASQGTRSGMLMMLFD